MSVILRFDNGSYLSEVYFSDNDELTDFLADNPQWTVA